MAIYRVCHNHIMALFSLPSCLFDYWDFTPSIRDKFPLGPLYLSGLIYCMRYVMPLRQFFYFSQDISMLGIVLEGYL